MTGQENPAGFYALYIVRSYRYSVHATQIFVVNSLHVAPAIVLCGMRLTKYMTSRNETARDEPEELEMMQNVAYGPLQLR